jgi:UDP-glucose-4-epimerase GalE
MDKRILVTGGAGYIGAHTCKQLAQAGYEPVVLDNLSNGHRDAVRWGPLITGDLGDPDTCTRALRDSRASAVVHFAGSILVDASMRDPGAYFQNNVVNTLHLLRAMAACDVRTLVFSSSCAVYGEPERIPIPETHPTRPINPYGETKLAAERALHWFGRAHAIRSVSLRYFNAAGADPDGEIGERHTPETHLIPLVVEAALGRLPQFELRGIDYPTPDGSAIRDLVHVTDLAQAHVQAIDYLRRDGASIELNVGTGQGTSVRQVVEAARRHVGRTFPVQERDRRPGDPAVLVADATRVANLLGWRPRLSDLDTLLDTAIAWHSRS